ncbi:MULTISPECIES: helicase HerA-like C-terminal domain-containing protein [unclassified Methylophaga]|jgi:DNA helicase HerA-like ATPase|uniref:helicase HerA-like C-terminal domain-containing protein n=5 Tax=Methylophaga TaxID=40222 RepID=UPI000C89125B|nr:MULTISPECIES: helicase HerA-like C-terminal domain-containing protein [unclassified Methylophaga]MAK65941.1 ATP-binding protein [Methylophaga sp.]MAY18682.1 ATP-binding protein [Methylophaga sp.]MBN46446.1 ATP-binding protein [Methylophaga sp.]HAO25695.1 ATP-binding protein [Methylophaga sp.]|tara:strand:+ start:14469 stop:15929 length:1461 start_codon:yes stop_codon:yes gene_type:complete
MAQPMFVGQADQAVFLLPQMANRHGLVAGATGTGKTVTLQGLAEGFSNIGVPVFAADIKGDLSGISQPGKTHPKITERVNLMQLDDFQFSGFPTTFWDMFGEQGHPVRTTISDMGPLLLSRLMNLNDTQQGVLTLIFRVADDNGWLVLDLKDLRAMLQFVAENASEFQTLYGNISAASVGAIQRRLLVLEDQGADKLFAEPVLNLDDLLQTDAQGKGIINLLAADKLMQSPQLYSTFLLWLMAELFDQLPEVGDPEKPKLVLFFDEAHLLFDDAPKALLDKIEQVVRLIRSKGVGVYFVTQNPTDIPDSVLGQLGNRIQHALRAYTAKDQKAVKAAAETFRDNPAFSTTEVITEMGVGEALVSMLDEKGRPQIVQRTMIKPPQGQIGPITPQQRQQLMQSSLVAGVYEKMLDRESAHEILAERAEKMQKAALAEQTEAAKESVKPARKSNRESVFEAFAKSAMRSVGSQIGRRLVRGIFGSLLNGK